MTNRKWWVAAAAALATTASLLSAAPAFAEDKDTATEAVVADPCNAYLAVQAGAGGAFNMGANPNPSTCGSQAGSWDLMYRWPSGPGTSFTTVKLDGATVRYGTGTPVTAPTDVDPSTNVSAWQYGDVLVTQQLKLVTNPFTGRADTTRISYTVQNKGAAAHEVGVRFMNDTEINYNDGAPFRVPSVGPVTTEQTYSGTTVPDNFTVFQNLADSTHVAAAILRGGEATAPDSVEVAAWPGINATAWDYATNPARAITSDSAYALYWNAATLAAGASRTYVTYYGIGALSTVTGDLDLGVTAPTTLAAAGDDYTPNPFSVVATVENPGFGAISNVAVGIYLPAGLSLASGSATQSVGTLPVGGSAQVTWQVLAAPQSAATTLHYDVTASGDGVSSQTLPLTLDLPGLNHPPVAVAGEDQVVDEGTTVHLDANASSDPDADPLTWAWTVMTGYSGPALALTGADTPTPSFATTDDGQYVLRLTVNDGTATSTDDLTVTVGNAAPVITDLLAPVDPVPLGTPIALSATFTDAGAGDTHTALFGLGPLEGPGSVMENTGNGTAERTFTVTEPGVYAARVTITDDDGGSATASHEVPVVVYDPSAGFVTGGGWISSPAGAYAVDSTLAGKATFGFVAKYLRGANTPTGSTEFVFHAARLGFHSTSYDWLVVSGPMAQYKGEGQVTGLGAEYDGTYQFTLTARDGDLLAAGGPDTFRIRIVREVGEVEQVLYDNGSHSSLAGGSVKIHK